MSGELNCRWKKENWREAECDCTCGDWFIFGQPG